MSATLPTKLRPSLVALALTLACGTESSQLPSAPIAPVPQVSDNEPKQFSDWGAPVNLGPVVNSPQLDINPSLSADGLRLYFVSRRPGGFGLNDIWVSRRASAESPWETPVNLGPLINSPSNDQGPQESHNGRLLFFTSGGRPGGHGALDIWVSHRADSRDDLAWGAPVNLGPSVNTAEGEREPQYLVGVEGSLVGRPAILYFNRGPIGPQGSDLFAVAVTPDGEPVGPAVLLAELSVPGANETGQSVRHDGRETVFMSNRAGTQGPWDIWFATRRSRHDPWSVPENLGAPVNTEFSEERPNLSFDGLTLFFDSDRAGAVGGLGQDIWMSTRTRRDLKEQ